MSGILQEQDVLIMIKKLYTVNLKSLLPWGERGENLEQATQTGQNISQQYEDF